MGVFSWLAPTGTLCGDPVDLQIRSPADGDVSHDQDISFQFVYDPQFLSSQFQFTAACQIESVFVSRRDPITSFGMRKRILRCLDDCFRDDPFLLPVQFPEVLFRCFRKFYFPVTCIRIPHRRYVPDPLSRSPLSSELLPGRSVSLRDVSENTPLFRLRFCRRDNPDSPGNALLK